jgi:hypothetical protein
MPKLKSILILLVLSVGSIFITLYFCNKTSEKFGNIVLIQHLGYYKLIKTDQVDSVTKVTESITKNFIEKVGLNKQLLDEESESFPGLCVYWDNQFVEILKEDSNRSKEYKNGINAISSFCKIVD